ncbi:tigger transposable element-derived protein 1-like [Bactrocera neohumeralis]|uniref:tigger transposable element-derived protein 1-like n=1 Tax=Bactrocera neohumeralis TaxID=98809 RepID=UPI002165F6F5|nr:tigger transposable element-derived protein 1-like [Bactrocera neohumeralis]
MNDNIKVIFLPPNTTALIQPMDQGVIAAFKKYYLRRTFNNLIDAIDKESHCASADVVRNFWVKYNVMQAVENIKQSWEEVSATTMSHAWKNIWTEYTTSRCGSEENSNDLNIELINLAQTVGFTDVDESDLIDILETGDEPLTNAEALALTDTPNKDDNLLKNSMVENERERSQFPISKLSEAFNHIQKAINIFEKFDKDEERVISTRNSINNSLQHYKDLFTQKKLFLSQKRIDSFFKPILSSDTPSSSQYQTSQRNIPDEDIQIIMSEISSEDFTSSTQGQTFSQRSLPDDDIKMLVSEISSADTTSSSQRSLPNDDLQKLLSEVLIPNENFEE